MRPASVILPNARRAPLVTGAAALASIGVLDCTAVQVVHGQFDAGRTLLWALVTLVPLTLAAGVVATRASWRLTLSTAMPLFAGATSAVLLLLVAADALVFPTDSTVDWFDRARSKLPGAAAFVGLGAVAKWLNSRSSDEKAAAEAAANLSVGDRFAIREARLALAAGNYVELHCAGNRRRLVRVPLSRLATSPDSGEMVRLHRSALVRASAIRRWHNDRSGLVAAELDDGTLVRVGRNYRRAAYDLRASCGSSQAS